MQYFDYILEEKDGRMFVNHEKNFRSGHLSHALTEFDTGKIIAFYSNCSGTRNRWAPGHNGFGWLEYKISTDYGDTWSNSKVFSYSYDSFINEPFTVSCEKAVSTQKDEIICFCIRNENPNGWEPYLEPVVIKSIDGGQTWNDVNFVFDKKGRIYDAIVKDGIIYVLLLSNNDFLCTLPEHQYCLYKSEDHGETFTLVSNIPGDNIGRAYGNLVINDDNQLICYKYNSKDEYNLDYFISDDMGKTWSNQGISYCAKRIRNPQVIKTKKGYFLHGRSGCVDTTKPMDFVLYTSLDGIHWDDGLYLYSDQNGQTAYYSNNLKLDLPNGKEKVIIQSSVPYSKGRTNILQFFITI